MPGFVPLDVDVEHPAVAKLRADGAPEAVIRTFARQVERLAAGETGLLAEADLQPVTELPDAEGFAEPDPQHAARLLRQTAVIKLNGGLGTSMGLTGPKSSLEVREGLSFLDVIARQITRLREERAVRVPLVLMDSRVTRPDALQTLAEADLDQAVPYDFLQGRVPKLDAATLEPVSWPANPELEWAPPGHGDLYPSLVASGMLDALIEEGATYAFVSNADNLGATLDLSLLAWFADSGAPFCMEVADRTRADRKGGHLAERVGGGGLVLRELAQAADEDLDAFQDTTRHRFFNTNNLWLDLHALREALKDGGGAFDLPLIVNRKTVDPRDKASTPAVQLETAMGAAIDVWDGAVAVRVPRSRFSPVKTTDDLLAIRSDAYVLDEHGEVHLAGARAGSPPDITLDADVYKLVDRFEERFPAGAPSLLGCASLTVTGDVSFGADVVVTGDVVVEGPALIEDGTHLQG